MPDVLELLKRCCNRKMSRPSSLIKSRTNLYAFATVTLLLRVVTATQPLSCLNTTGSPVDWWTALKFPRGDAFAYMDSNAAQDSSGKLVWTLGYDWAVTSGVPLAYTLQQLYKHAGQFGYIMWNDEFPGGDPPVWEGGAHAKGVLGLDQSSGFYLLHSVPKFPAAPCVNCPDGIGNGSYTGIALAQQLYGQSFMCMTMPTSELDKVAQMAIDEEAWVYDHMLPAELQTRYPAAKALIADPHSTTALPLGPPIIHWGTPLTSLGGQQGVSFAKSSSTIPLLLYEQVVEPFMQSGMLWETWQHGPGALPQCCPSPAQQPFSFTVAAVAVPDAAGWYVNRDHSKWGVTSHHAPACCRSQGTSGSLDPSGQTAVCFGDLNRQEHQGYRGGSATCFLGNRPLWAAWSDLVQKTQDCSSDAQPSTTKQHSALQTLEDHNMAEADMATLLV